MLYKHTMHMHADIPLPDPLYHEIPFGLYSLLQAIYAYYTRKHTQFSNELRMDK